MFRECFAGKGGATKALAKRGLPVDAGVEAFELSYNAEMDLRLPNVVRRELDEIFAGRVFGSVLGTPCNSWGPLFQNFGPGTRTIDVPEGDGTVESEREGNLLAYVTMLLCIALHLMGGFFWIENPLRSYLWRSKWIVFLIKVTGATFMLFD